LAHVIPYQGIKRALAHVIVPLIPDDVSTMYEPFAGSAAVAIATAYSGKAAALSRLRSTVPTGNRR
jgi:site-specific DNA-adenine methylase